MGSGSKTNIFYVIMRDFGEDYSTKTMWRLSRMTSYFMMNRGFSFGISDVTPSKKLLEEKQALLDAGYRKCDEYIMEMKKGTLQCQPGCTAEETLESVMLKVSEDFFCIAFISSLDWGNLSFNCIYSAFLTITALPSILNSFHLNPRQNLKPQNLSFVLSTPSS